MRLHWCGGQGLLLHLRVRALFFIYPGHAWVSNVPWGCGSKVEMESPKPKPQPRGSFLVVSKAEILGLVLFACERRALWASGLRLLLCYVLLLQEYLGSSAMAREFENAIWVRYPSNNQGPPLEKSQELILLHHQSLSRDRNMSC
ncbi:uncharacterized protein BDV17DRAFT_214678 [Aspergillus undulatus]|uniref:uncharacterized protein n=1 Tax=Aspergillus undulatus TaxID=1810928 RepID=UPI003CCD4A2A